ncbi:hypothetical protein [Syntrophaceticus schinkii]|uniref:Uncharacterized protein n=1 Tax=Syntrophaceticus schinkii TaxID=499207 RepID=A0A0B7MJQ8_9FIRM|nr:hypothetical protein [Syntrophaceticus schinkii]CEO88191.1 hypothetical protein SSCH_1550003 [Syntrophaceticus schinkii]
MPEHKTQLIKKLTGVYTSKHSYYAELKEKITELSKRNSQLELINELAQEFNISLPKDYLDNTLKKIYERVQDFFLPEADSYFNFKGPETPGKLLLPCR